MEEKKVTPNPKALFPIGLFLILYLHKNHLMPYILILETEYILNISVPGKDRWASMSCL